MSTSQSAASNMRRFSLASDIFRLAKWPRISTKFLAIIHNNVNILSFLQSWRCLDACTVYDDSSRY
jgi:hypothetical protein